VIFYFFDYFYLEVPCKIEKLFILFEQQKNNTTQQKMSTKVQFAEFAEDPCPRNKIHFLEKQIKLLKEDNACFRFCSERRAVTIENIRKQKKAAELRVRELEDEVLELRARLQREGAALYGVEPELEN